LSKITVKQAQPEGIAAGATMTARIATGRRIHALYLNYNGTDQSVADFTEIRVFINSQVIQRFSGTERDKLNQFDGMAAAAGTLTIPFDRQKLLTVAGREQTALNTQVPDANGLKISSMYVEIDVKAGTVIAASDISIYSKESDPILRDTNGNAYGAGVIPYIRREQRTVTGADSDYQISDLVNAGVNAPDKAALDRVTFVPSAGVIRNLKISRNNYDVFDRTDSLNRVIQRAGVKVPVAGLYTIDTKENGHGGDVISLLGMTDYRYKLDVSAAATVTCISEYMGALSSN